MKHIFLTLIGFVLFIGTLQSQNDYIRYYQLIEKVKTDKKNKKTDSLVFNIKKAFDLVDYIHIDNLKLGRGIAKKQNNEELLIFCKIEIDKLTDNLNIDLKTKLDSVGKEDQRIRGGKYYKAKEYYRKCLYDTIFKCNEKKRLKSKQLMEEWWRVDSCNVEFVKNIILEYGYPSEKIVGKETNSMVGIILLHYDKDTANHIMGKYLEIALKEGKIKPRMYAWIIDRHLMNVGKNQKYYSIPTPWKKMNNEKKLIYNKNRLAIGLKSLDDIKIIVKKNSVTVKY
jgi:hypothetical protein